MLGGNLLLTSLVIVFGFSGCDAAHHLEELLEIDFSVSVFVDLGDSLIELGLRVYIAELFASEQLQELRGVDLSAMVRVDHLEGRPQVGLS